MQRLISLLLAVPLVFISSGVARAAKCPNLLAVIDRSGSMSQANSGGTRWTVARDGLKKVVAQLDGKLRIGLMYFPAGGCNSKTPVAPDYKTRDAINKELDALGPSGGTPSGTAVRDAAALPALREPDRKQYILLITDGGPGCSGEPDTRNGTVSEIKKARMQKPEIVTFVVGFGGGLTQNERDALNEMAMAGGRPAPPGPAGEVYYKADNAEELNQVLRSILTVVETEFDKGVCDDSCYSNPCENAGDRCIRGECRKNPCENVPCGKDMYCYTDGESPGMCVRACKRPCPAGTRCSQGSCIQDPCRQVCLPGTVCDQARKSCQQDPLCTNLPEGEQCKRPSQCQFGKCVDDPCLFVTCPMGTTCVHWDGSCVPVFDPGGEVDGGDPGTDFEGRREGGCAAAPAATEALPPIALLASVAAYLLLRRRRG